MGKRNKGNRGVVVAERCRKVKLPGGVVARICFWCDAVAPLTRDHVVPLGADGPKGASNVVPACAACQHERSRLVNLFCVARELREAASILRPEKLRTRVTRQRRKQGHWVALRAKWVALETERWGSSPSGELDWTLPPLPEDAPPVPPAAVPIPPVSTATPRPLGAWELD